VTLLMWVALFVPAAAWLSTARTVSVLAWKFHRLALRVRQVEIATTPDFAAMGEAVRLSAEQRQANAARAAQRREELRERRQQRMADLVRQRLSQAVTLTGTAPSDGEVQQ